MKNKITYKSFLSMYPNDDARLWALLNARTKESRKCLNPNCKGNIDRDYKRLKNKKGFLCVKCLIHVHPLADSPFDNTKISLTDLFEILYKKMSSSSGMSSQAIQDYYGFAYSTAHFLSTRIMQHMGECIDHKFTDTVVEIDESYISTGNKGLTRNFPFGRGRENMRTTSVLAIVERGGKCILKKIPDTSADTIIPLILKHVDKNCTIHTDEWGAYNSLAMLGYKHFTVNHNNTDKNKKYVDGEASTNSCENLFSNLSRLVYGTHRSVSDDLLPLYLNEIAFKHSFRNEVDYGFKSFLEEMEPLSSTYSYKRSA